MPNYKVNLRQGEPVVLELEDSKPATVDAALVEHFGGKRAPEWDSCTITDEDVTGEPDDDDQAEEPAPARSSRAPRAKRAKKKGR